ncbi:unnamed protein product [Ilex paraguariensis]|uniref:Uncharacterized protein n=1 Tax=Ilex paraguariensis TaxID=185542 RepID=A0ABC8QP33_9AQUA
MSSDCSSSVFVAACCSSAIVCTIVGIHLGCSWLYTCGYRSQLWNQYGLKKTPCNDCLVHWCCGPCALCQEYRELQNRGFDMSIGWRANAARQTGGVAMAPVVEKGMAR